MAAASSSATEQQLNRSDIGSTSAHLRNENGSFFFMQLEKGSKRSRAESKPVVGRSARQLSCHERGWAKGVQSADERNDTHLHFSLRIEMEKIETREGERRE